jgi:hypothetical protein
VTTVPYGVLSLEIAVTTSQSDDRSRAVATEKLVPRPMVDCTTEAIQYQTTRFLSLEASKSSHVLLDVKYAKALYTVVQLAMHIYPKVPNSIEPFFCTATFHSSPPSIGSSLPQDSCVFQWDRNAIAVRYHARRIVLWWAGRRHGRVVSVVARRADQLANARHLLPHGSTAHDAVGR